MTTGCSHEPWDGGSHGLVLLRGAVGMGLGGPAPLLALRLVLHGVSEHHWGSQHPSAPQHPVGQPWLFQGGRGCSEDLRQP